MKLPIQVDVIVFHKFEDGYKYLIMQRTDERGGFWQPVTGGVEDGEKLIDSALREVWEETGYAKDEIIRLIDLDYSFQFKLKNKDWWITEYVFGVEVSHSKYKRLAKEHQNGVWCTYDEAMQYLIWETNKETITKLKNIIEENTKL